MALKGIKVIEFAGLAPGPFCGKILRDLGARVIRIDKTGPQIDIDQLSQGKESIALNLRAEKGIQIARKLAFDADVLIEPFRKGVMERLGLGPSVLMEKNPKLIYARLTGYGQSGELSSRAGHDINYLAYSGVLSCLGRKNEKPYAPVNILADFAGGGLMCAFAILTALYERERHHQQHQQHQSDSFKGKILDCSMVEGAAYVSSWLWTSRNISGIWEGDSRGTNMLDGGYFAYDTYETKDGKYIACGALEPQFYAIFLEKLKLNEANAEINEKVIQEKFKTKSQAEWIEIFKDSDACVAPVLDLDSAPEFKHNQERQSFIQLLPNGDNDKESSRSKNKFMPTMNWIQREVTNESLKRPLVGENTERILNEIGYSEQEIKQLIEERIVEKNSIPKSKL